MVTLSYLHNILITMDLSAIKFYCERREGGIKKLASDIGMSEPNLHRCIRLNKIQASDLEKISTLLGVDIRVFFDEQACRNPVKIGDGNTAVNISGTINGGQNVTNYSCENEVRTLRALLSEKERVIQEKERTIQLLLENLKK